MSSGAPMRHTVPVSAATSLLKACNKYQPHTAAIAQQAIISIVTVKDNKKKYSGPYNYYNAAHRGHTVA
jgi:hypothetical protein